MVGKKTQTYENVRKINTGQGDNRLFIRLFIFKKKL